MRSFGRTGGGVTWGGSAAWRLCGWLWCAVVAGALSSSAVLAQVTEDVDGVVLEASTRTPIQDVILRLEGTDISAASDRSGRFVLRGVPAGSWTLVVSHLRYGTQSHDIAVGSGSSTSLEIRLAEEAIELEPLVVEAESRTERERRTTGASFWEVDRERIERAIGTSRHMGDLIRQTIPGLKLRQQNNFARGDVCLEFRAAATISIVNQRACNHPKVLLDGVPVADPTSLYASVPLGDLERIQVIPPGEASTRYGSGSLYGVVLIETRRPGVDTRAPEATRFAASPTFDWDLDPEGHSSRRALLYSAAGNALGLVAGLAIARECVNVATNAEIRSDCGTSGTLLSSSAAFVLPAVGAALGARLAGSTELSQGRFVPSLIGAGIMLFPGYALSLSEAASDSQAVSTIGAAFLAAGVPIAVTLADRLYRKLR